MSKNVKEIQCLELKMIHEVQRIASQNDLTYYLAYGSVIGAVRENGFIQWDTDIDIIVKYDDYKRFCDLIACNLNIDYQLFTYWDDSNYDSLKARIGLRNEEHTIVHVDIFPIVGISKNKLVRFLIPKIAYLIYRSYFIKKMHPKVNYDNNRLKRIIVYFLKTILILIPSRVLIYIHEYIAQRIPCHSSSDIFNICGSYGAKEIIPQKYLGEPIYKKFEREELPIPNMYHEYLEHFYGDYLTPKQTDYI